MKQIKSSLIISAFLGLLLIAGSVWSQQSSSQEQNHHSGMSEMNKRGNQGMGFDQDKTTHHFFLTTSGGIIQVAANSRDDKTSRDQIQMHLHHISHMFADGNFEIPMFVHDQTPPGVPEMKRLKDQISYTYEETDNGGRVVISTKSQDAIKAIHDFLRFQIEQHHTGDSLEVKSL